MAQLDALGRPAELALLHNCSRHTLGREAAHELKTLKTARSEYHEATAAYEELIRRKVGKREVFTQQVSCEKKHH